MKTGRKRKSTTGSVLLNIAGKGLLAAAAFALVGAATAQAGLTVADPAADWVAWDGENMVGGTQVGWSYWAALDREGTGWTELPASTLGSTNIRGFGGIGDDDRLPGVAGDVNYVDNGDDSDFTFFGGTANQAEVGKDLIIHTDHDDGNVVTVRYTVQADDLASGNNGTIAGSFRNLETGDSADHNSVEVAVVHNSQVLFFAEPDENASGSNDTDILLQQDGTFNVNATLAVGDTIDFVVDDRGNHGYVDTALRAEISAIPEPASGMLFVLVAGLLCFARRRARA